MAKLQTTTVSSPVTMSSASTCIMKPSAWLTFEYVLAMFSLTAATLMSAALVFGLIGMWATKGAIFIPVLKSIAATNVLSVAILTVLLAGMSYILFARVTRAVMTSRGDFTGRLAYKLPTYGSAFVLVLATLPLLANLLSVLVNSLVMIGVANPGLVYGALYLGVFLPSLIALVIIGVSLFFVAKIVCGHNMSRLASIVLLGVSGILAVAMIITLAVQVHTAPKSLIKTPTVKYNTNSFSL